MEDFEVKAPQAALMDDWVEVAVHDRSHVAYTAGDYKLIIPSEPGHAPDGSTGIIVYLSAVDSWEIPLDSRVEDVDRAEIARRLSEGFRKLGLWTDVR